MKKHPFASDFAALSGHYSQLLRKYGDEPSAVQQRDRATQESRMAILTQVGDLSQAKILDFGCGTGHFLTLLKRTGFVGEYVGIDICPDMVKVASGKFPSVCFEARDILAAGLSEDFDFVLINGVFNHRIKNNWGFVTQTLRTLWPHVRKAIAFNSLSNYVDYFADGLCYLQPERVFAFCKEELSPSVVLRHDYALKPGIVPYEFTVYVYVSEQKPRQALQVVD